MQLSSSVFRHLTPKLFKEKIYLKFESLLWSLNDTLGGFHRVKETVLIFPMDFLEFPGRRPWLTILARLGDDLGLTVVTYNGWWHSIGGHPLPFLMCPSGSECLVEECSSFYKEGLVFGAKNIRPWTSYWKLGTSSQFWLAQACMVTTKMVPFMSLIIVSGGAWDITGELQETFQEGSSLCSWCFEPQQNNLIIW